MRVGPAYTFISTRRPNFTEIEKAVSLSHYRPYFKLACHANHAGSKGLWFDLGNALVPPENSIMLAGPSDAGLADPGTCTAGSIHQLTTNLILYRNITVTALIISNCLGELTEEIRNAFATAHDELADQAETMRRQNSN